MAELREWESFYVIVGGGAAALIGLQFVVMTLIADKPHLISPEGGAAFATPTIVHFATALLLSAGLRVPWHSLVSAAVFWGIVGLCGTVYTIIVARRMRRQPVYKPDLEDWLAHYFVPFAAYATLTLSAFAASSHADVALFGVGTAALLLLFIGIHNAWDTVAYQVFVNLRKPKPKD